MTADPRAEAAWEAYPWVFMNDDDIEEALHAAFLAGRASLAEELMSEESIVRAGKALVGMIPADAASQWYARAALKAAIGGEG